MWTPPPPYFQVLLSTKIDYIAYACFRINCWIFDVFIFSLHLSFFFMSYAFSVFYVVLRRLFLTLSKVNLSKVFFLDKMVAEWRCVNPIVWHV